MRRTRKHNKNFKKTRRNKNGGGQGSSLPLQPPPEPLPSLPTLLPPLPESPPSSPRNNKPKVLVNIESLKPVEKYTYNWHKRQQPKIALKKASELPVWKKLIGIKNKPPSPVTLNSEGYPVKSAFNINKNSGFKP
jgi:hypothetical protein